MTRELPIVFGQQDYSQKLGFSTSITIAQSGCLLSSYAMVARYYGKQTDPVELNEQLKEENLYIDQDELSDTVLQRVFPDIIFVETLLYPNDPPTPADLTKLGELMRDPTTSVILEIDRGEGYTHFVVCVGVNGAVLIADPVTKTVIDFSSKYGDPIKSIIKFLVYRGTPVAIDQQLIDQLRGQRDANWSLYQNQLQTTKSIQDQLKDVQDNANGFQSQLNTDEQEITSLKQDVKRITDENASILANYQAKLKEDSTAVDIGIKSPSIINDLRDYIRAIAEYLRVTANKKTDKEIVEEVLGEVAKLKQINVTSDNLAAIRSNYERIITYLDSKGLEGYLKQNKLSPADSNAGEHIVYFIGLVLQPHVAMNPVKTSTSQSSAGFFSRTFKKGLSYIWT